MKLIKINPEHYIIVDDSEIKEGDWVYQPMTNAVYKTSRTDNSDIGYKITHSTEPLDKSLFFTDRVWGCERLSLGEVKELLGEVNVEKKVKNEMGIPDYLPTNSMSPSMQGSLEFGIKCYNQALEDNKEKKYTEEDMKKAWNAAYIDAMSIDEETYKPLFFQDFIQSLQPKTEWGVEFIDGKLTLKQ